jgi:hypothetical protein
VTLRIVTQHHQSALRSRRDLRRVHLAMGTRRIIVHALHTSHLAADHPSPLRILEIGAGDGNLMCGVAQRLGRRWQSVELTLLDQLDLVEASTIDRFAAFGWRIRPVVSDVLAWAAAADVPGRAKPWDLIIANLFLHHFEGAQLSGILSAVEARTDCFFACEPRRSRMANWGSHLIGALGVNAVTRADAVTSVRAGFQQSEISTLWPRAPHWKVKEYAAGLFSHCFFAERSFTDARHAA